MNIDHLEIDKNLNKTLHSTKSRNESYRSFDNRIEKEIGNLFFGDFRKGKKEEIFECFPFDFKDFFKEIIDKNLIATIYNRKYINFHLSKKSRYKSYTNKNLGYLIDSEARTYVKFVKKDNFLFMRLSNKKEFFRIYKNSENNFIMQEVKNKKIISNLICSNNFKKLNFKSHYPNGNIKKEISSIDNMFNLKEVCYTLLGKVDSVRYFEFKNESNYLIKKTDINKQIAILQKKDASEWSEDYLEDILNLSDYEIDLIALNFND